MKVTVCFGPVRVIVPCGDGEILVKDLIRQAVHRYKKATGKVRNIFFINMLRVSHFKAFVIGSFHKQTFTK